MKIKKPKKSKVRKSWGILNPSTKIIPDKTKYKRSKEKKGWEKILDRVSED